jgi:hypothetical protein
MVAARATPPASSTARVTEASVKMVFILLPSHFLL